MSNQLSVVERRDLRHHEAIIEKGMATFIEVGQALQRIRDDELYRDSHKTFEKYVKDRWGMARQRAYQLIDAAEVKADLSTMVDKSPRVEEIKTERQLRELVDVPTEDIASVVDKATEIAGDAPITAKVLHEAKQAVLDCDPEPPAPPKPKKPSPAEQAVENASIGQAIIKVVNEAIRLLKAVEEVPGTELLVVRERSIERDLQSVKAAILVTIPHSVCPRCKGKGCPQCGNHGWVNSQLAKELGDAQK